jgi:hypothetical protein
VNDSYDGMAVKIKVIFLEKRQNQLKSGRANYVTKQLKDHIGTMIYETKKMMK